MSSYRNRPAPNNPGGDSSGFSFSNTKSMFESFNNSQLKSKITNMAKNPTVQRTAVTLAKDERVRNAATNAAKNPETRQAAMNAAQSPSGRGAILEMAKQFENKPLMGFGASAPRPPSTTSSQPSWEATTPTRPREQLYPSLTGDPSWNNSSRFSREGLSPMAPGYGTGVQERPRSTDPSLNALIDELFPVHESNKNAPPARPPPPKLGSRSIPNLAGFNNSGFEPTITDPHGVVKYPYKSANSDELNCESHDTVLLKREVDDQWIYGTNTRTGQSGIFPINFLHIKIPLAPTQKGLSWNSQTSPTTQSWNSQTSPTTQSWNSPTSPTTQSWGTTNTIAPQPTQNNQPTPIISSRSLFNSVSHSSSIPSDLNNTTSQIARALYDYDTGVEGDLFFKRGDLIIVHERVDDDWCKGEVNHQTGIFPVDYVDVPDLTAIPMKKTIAPALANSLAKLSFKPRFVTALYGYCSGIPEDLIFEEGDVIQVVEEVNDEWMKGMLNGKIGLLPLTYVQENE